MRARVRRLWRDRDAALWLDLSILGLLAAGVSMVAALVVVA